MFPQELMEAVEAYNSLVECSSDEDDIENYHNKQIDCSKQKHIR